MITLDLKLSSYRWWHCDAYLLHACNFDNDCWAISSVWLHICFTFLYTLKHTRVTVTVEILLCSPLLSFLSISIGSLPFPDLSTPKYSFHHPSTIISATIRTSLFTASKVIQPSFFSFLLQLKIDKQYISSNHTIILCHQLHFCALENSQDWIDWTTMMVCVLKTHD